MGNSNIKSRLVLECPDDTIFLEFCKFINAFTKDVECLYFVNKNYIIYKNNEQLYKSQVIFRLKKFSSLIFIWKTLCSWNNISDKNITFQLLADIKNQRFMEFNNDVITLDVETKPENFDKYFEHSTYQSEHVGFSDKHHNKNENDDYVENYECNRQSAY
jgi:hypothetical protein